MRALTIGTPPLCPPFFSRAQALEIALASSNISDTLIDLHIRTFNLSSLGCLVSSVCCPHTGINRRVAGLLRGYYNDMSIAYVPRPFLSLTRFAFSLSVSCTLVLLDLISSCFARAVLCGTLVRIAWLAVS